MNRRDLREALTNEERARRAVAWADLELQRLADARARLEDERYRLAAELLIATTKRQDLVEKLLAGVPAACGK